MLSVTIPAWRITATVLAGVGQILTLFRVLYRAKKQQIWMDDLLAAFSGLLSLTALPCLWIYTDFLGIGPLNQPQHNRLVAYWIQNGTFIAIVWLTRLSLVCSLIRIIPPFYFIRRLAYFLVIFFISMGIALLTQKILFCYHDNAWESLEGLNLQCTGNLAITATEIALELSSDILMMAILVRAMVVLNAVALRRWLLLTIFSGSLLISGGNIVHAVFLIWNTGLLERYIASIEAFSSLIAINLPVLVVFFSLLACRTLEDPDKLSGNISSQRSFASITCPIKLQPPQHRQSSFYSSEKLSLSVDSLCPLRKIHYDDVDKSTASSRYFQQMQSDEHEQATPHASSASDISTNRISHAILSTSEHIGPMRLSSSHNSRISLKIPSSIYSDGIRLSAYPFLNPLPSVHNNDLSVVIPAHARPSSLSGIPSSVYSASIYSQDFNGENEDMNSVSQTQWQLLEVPLSYETSSNANKENFRLHPRILAVPTRTSSRPVPF